MPEETTYDGYLQLENGVGMVRLLKEEVDAYLKKLPGDDSKTESDHCHRRTGGTLSLREHVADLSRRNIPMWKYRSLQSKNRVFRRKDHGVPD